MKDWPNEDELQRWRTGFERYEYIRTLNVTQFRQIWMRATLVPECNFDEIVDELRRASDQPSAPTKAP